MIAMNANPSQNIPVYKKSIAMKFMLSTNKHHSSLIILGIFHSLFSVLLADHNA
jgi:hypothetical protein